MSTLKLISTIFISLGLTLSAGAARVQSANPDAAKLLDQFQSSHGFQGAAGARLTGKVSWVGLPMNGTIVEVYGGYGKAILTQEFPSLGKFESGWDGELIWQRTPTTGAQVRAGWVACEHLRRNAIAQNIDWRKLYGAAEIVGVEEIDGVKCWKIALTPLDLMKAGDEGRPPADHWYLTQENGALTRVQLHASSTGGEDAVSQVDFKDWKPVGEKLVAHRREVTISDFTLVLSYESVELDLNLPAGFFAAGPDVVAAATASQEDEADESGASETSIRIETLEVKHVATIRLTCKHAELKQTISTILPETMGVVFGSGARVVGAPFVRYHTWGDDLDIEGGIPVAEPIMPKGRVQPRALPGGPAIVTTHVGPYELLGDTHSRVLKYVEDNEIQLAGAPWEEYLTDPGMEPDPKKWKTKVIYPIN